MGAWGQAGGGRRGGGSGDRRYQQCRPDALEDRVAEYQDAEAGGDGAEQCADPIEREPKHEAPLTTPTVRELAAGDHEDRHDQEEQRDRGLDTLYARVEVIADVVDHHVNVQPREVAVTTTNTAVCRSPMKS